MGGHCPGRGRAAPCRTSLCDVRQGGLWTGCQQQLHTRCPSCTVDGCDLVHACTCAPCVARGVCRLCLRACAAVVLAALPPGSFPILLPGQMHGTLRAAALLARDGHAHHRNNNARGVRGRRGRGASRHAGPANLTSPCSIQACDDASYDEASNPMPRTTRHRTCCMSLASSAACMIQSCKHCPTWPTPHWRLAQVARGTPTSPACVQSHCDARVCYSRCACPYRHVGRWPVPLCHAYAWPTLARLSVVAPLHQHVLLLHTFQLQSAERSNFRALCAATAYGAFCHWSTCVCQLVHLLQNVFLHICPLQCTQGMLLPSAWLHGRRTMTHSGRVRVLLCAPHLQLQRVVSMRAAWGFALGCVWQRVVEKGVGASAGSPPLPPACRSSGVGMPGLQYFMAHVAHGNMARHPSPPPFACL